MYLNDIENTFLENLGLDGINVQHLKMFFILYADDIVIFAESKTELQTSLDL